MAREAPGPVVRFAVFEVDRRSGELRKRGVRVRLRDQAFQILAYLLEHPGEVVTREELQRRLWAADTFVDFDRGLNKAVNRLREALDDSAETPRFIETLPKRGYRFIAPVETVPSPQETQPPPQSPDTARDVGHHHTGRWAILAATVVAAAAAVATYTRLSPHPHAPTGSVRVVLADFDNHTGDQAFDDTLKQALAIDLEQSSSVHVVSDDEIVRTLRLMKRRPDDPLTTAVARDVCRRNGANAVLGGSLTVLNSEYVLGLNAVDCQTGEVVVREQARASRKQDVLGAVDDAIADLRRKLGESTTTASESDKHVHEMLTTVSLDAFQAYASAERNVFVRGGWSAIPLFERATAIDPDFAYAHAAVALVLGSMGEAARAASHAKRAYELRNRVSEWERFFITVQYNDRVTGDIEKNVSLCDLWTQAYPQERTAHNRLAITYEQLGQPARALAELEQARVLGHDHPVDIGFWATTAMRLERSQDAAVLMRQALERSPDRIAFRHALHRSNFLTADANGMAAQVEWATRTPNAEALFVDASDVDAYYGRTQTARRWLQRAVTAATRGGFKGNAAVWSATDALRWALYASAAETRQQARAALDFEDNWETRALAATALARVGDVTRASELITKLNAAQPFGTLVQQYWLPVIRAELEIHAGHARKAVATLDAVTPYELADTRMPLLPAFVRGEAYLAARDGRAAADEFRKLLQHRGLVGYSPLGALAHVGLARALVLAHDRRNAAREYETFLDLWKDADAGIPIFMQAKTEHRASQWE